MDTQTALRDDPPIRLFKSDFLEFFSHISPGAVAAIWTPVTLFFLWRAIVARPEGVSLLYVPVGVLVGWAVWTFCEYTLHRFLFHYHPRTERLKRMFFLMHGVHHAQPMCRTRLVMPPALSVPMSFVFFGAAYLIFVPILGLAHWLNPVFAGLVGGYLIYDLMHYSIHHSSVKSGWWYEFRKHHLRHHGACDFLRFGVTTTFWDRVFGTMPNAPCQELLEQRAAKQSN
jgi:sterol desaturase/sphingolipid hydroxylase (fatty acid hydroxylase superfamily)